MKMEYISGLSETQEQLIIEMAKAMSKHESLSPFRVVSSAMHMYRPHSISWNMGDMLAALKHYNKAREKDAQKYLDSQRPTL